MWQKILSALLLITLIVTTVLFFTRKLSPCCLCSSFRYHAPCLLDLKTGTMTELPLYQPHDTLVAEPADLQPETGTFSFIRFANISGTKDTACHRIDLQVPDDKTLFPALCSDCRKLLPQGYTLRYIFADLYKKEEIRLYPIEMGTVFSLRCYQITIERNVETCSNRVIIQGILHE